MTDARGAYNEHNIRIINADEMGSVDFIVYGYMNRVITKAVPGSVSATMTV